MFCPFTYYSILFIKSEKMKKILEVVGRMDRAGQETFLMNVLRTHDPSKYEIWFSVNSEKVGDYELEIQQLGGHVWHNPYTITLKNLRKYAKAFRQFLKTEGPFDVVHCHTYLFGGFILRLAAQESIPVLIMHSHSTSDGKTNTLVRRLYRWGALRLIKHYATHWVACGAEAYETFFKEKCMDNNLILNNAILMSQFNFESTSCNTIRQQLNIPSNSKIIINIARFSTVKNHEKIVSVFKYFHDTLYPNSYLLLVGEGERLEIIKNLVTTLNLQRCIIFLGIRSDIPLLLNAADVLLMPSLFEGLPVSLVEAQAAGLPCVISNTIPHEVDMGLDLVHFVPLYASDEQWSKIIMDATQTIKPSYQSRYEKLTARGYTIASTWKKLTLLYG